LLLSGAKWSIDDDPQTETVGEINGETRVPLEIRIDCYYLVITNNNKQNNSFRALPSSLFQTGNWKLES